MDTDTGEGTHGGLHDFGVIAIGSVERADDIVNAEPIAGADDGAEIAGVLDSVQSQG